MRKQLISALLCIPLAAPALAEEDLSVSVKRLTLDAATKVAQGAIAACREKGIQIGVTVVDRNGIPQVTLRDTLAPQITLPISEGKAKASANFMAATKALADRANTPIGRAPGLVMSTGGLTIEAAGSFYGAVGVSGAPSGETDEECAQAGIETILDDLEMAM
jgi:uncharacterized protein GlcG (DUF336 family)